MNLKYELVTKDNLDFAVKVQNTIFPDCNGRQNYIEGITNDPYRKEMINWIVFDNKEPIGVVGLYSYNEYPEDAWLSWFGVLPEKRNKGYASKMFDYFEYTARQKNYKAIRVYTSEEYPYAMNLYSSKDMVKEPYKNKQESKEIIDETIIFSKSLIDENVKMWNDKFLGLTAQEQKEKNIIIDFCI